MNKSQLDQQAMQEAKQFSSFDDKMQQKESEDKIYNTVYKKGGWE